MTAKTKQPKEVKYLPEGPIEYQESADTVFIVRSYRELTEEQAKGLNVYFIAECNKWRFMGSSNGELKEAVSAFIAECNKWRFMGSSNGELKDARRFTRRSHAVNCINRQKQFDRFPTKYEILECKVGMYIGEKTYWNE